MTHAVQIEDPETKEKFFVYLGSDNRWTVFSAFSDGTPNPNDLVVQDDAHLLSEALLNRIDDEVSRIMANRQAQSSGMKRKSARANRSSSRMRSASKPASKKRKP